MRQINGYAPVNVIESAIASATIEIGSRQSPVAAALGFCRGCAAKVGRIGQSGVGLLGETVGFVAPGAPPG